MSIISRGSVLRLFGGKRFASLWERVEQSAGMRFESVEDLLQSMLEGLERWKAAVAREGDYSAMKKQHENQLEEYGMQIQGLKNEIKKQTVSNGEFTNNLLDIYDLTERVAFDRHLSAEKTLDSIRAATKAALDASGVQIVEDVNVRFNPEKHQAVSVTYTDTPDLNDHVAECLKSGIIRNGICIRAEEVVVYKFKA